MTTNFAVSQIPSEEWAKIPEHCREGLARYFQAGVPVGDFLTAVLSNDLTRAVLYADDINLPALRAYIHFLHHNAPPMSYGSKENYEVWMKHGGLRGSPWPTIIANVKKGLEGGAP